MATEADTGKASPQASGPPRWTYGLGAIVGAAALAWTIISYFIPKSEPAGAPGTAGVTISGTGSVGVGSMSGGTITVGAPAAAASRPAGPAK